MKYLFTFTVGFLALICINPNTVSAQTPSPEYVDVALVDGYGYYLIPSKYSGFALQWTTGTLLQYSLDGVNYQSPSESSDETEFKNDTYSYSYLYNISGQQSIHIRSNTSTRVRLNLIPDISTQHPDGIGNSLLEPGQVNTLSGANYSELSIINRAVWGANESYSDWDPAYWQADEIIVHHTVMVGNTSDYSQTVRSIYYYHAVTLGWGDIGYNYLIDPNGKIYEGRRGGEGAIGAHTYTFNSGSIGIALIGDFTNSPPTDAALESLENLMVERALINGISLSWGSTVTGHKDHQYNNTACPGERLYSILPNFVADAESTRATQTNGTIATKRNNMLTELTNYLDVRLELTFSDPNLTLAQREQLIPKHSGIASILSMSETSAVIEVESWSYNYNNWHDDTYDRVKMLYLLFSLDPNFINVNILPGYVYLNSKPINGKTLLIGDNLQLYFSQEVVPGTGNIEIRKISDQSLVESLDVQSSKVTFVDRSIVLLPDNGLEKGVEYYVTVCSSCVKNTTNIDFAGFTDTSTFNFNKAFKMKWQSNYDADTYSDIAIFDPPTVKWYIQRSSESTNAAPYIRAFGWSGVSPLVSGDYDGDGKTDIGIFDPQNAHWYIQQSSKASDAAPYFRAFGWRGVTHIPSGDYDGDGKTDIAIFFPETARWFIQMSSKPANADPYIRPFGWKTAVPVTGGDYDGDGKTDIAIFDPDSAKWYIQMSSQPANAAPYIRAFGWKGATPIMGGDYDGDGKTDLAVYAKESGDWYIQLSSHPANSGPIKRTLGGMGQIPLMRGDYDGDGATEIGVYNPKTVEWKLLYSNEDFNTQLSRKYGWAGIVPL